jgi:hypothetical protein
MALFWILAINSFIDSMFEEKQDIFKKSSPSLLMAGLIIINENFDKPILPSITSY